MKKSTAYALISHVWEHNCEEVSHSWRTVNASMHTAVSLAITSGLTFVPDDFRRVYDEMRGSYWFGQYDRGSYGEGFYVTACKEGNASACKSFEAWKERPPFVFGGKRLYVGSQLAWGDAKYLKVTSFAENGESLVACSYKTDEESMGGYGAEHKIDKRITISIKEMREAERKTRAKNAARQETARVLRAIECHWPRMRVEEETVRGWDKKQRKEAMAWLGRDYQHHNDPAPSFFPAQETHA
jgi:hypothetical protein